MKLIRFNSQSNMDQFADELEDLNYDFTIDFKRLEITVETDDPEVVTMARDWNGVEVIGN